MNALELVSHYIPPIAASHPIIVGTGILCAIPAIDLTFCALKDLDGINFKTPSLLPEKKQDYLDRQDKLKTSLRIHAIGAAILGACAANLFPGSGAVGAVGFMAYARFSWEREFEAPTPPLTICLTGYALKVLSVYKGKIAHGIFSKSVEICRWAGSCIHTIAIKVLDCARAVIHGVKIGFRAAGKLCHYVIVLPAKGLQAIGHVFKVFFHALHSLVHHPVAGLGVLAGVICLIGAVKHRHLFKGAMGAVARIVHRCVKGLLKAVPFVFRGVVITVKTLGKVLWAVPDVLIYLAKTIISIFRFILHPTRAWKRPPVEPRALS
jgi:hypothetical protein